MRSGKYIGKLPPGAAEDLSSSLESYIELSRQGIIKGVKVSAGPGCPVAARLAGKVFAMNEIPLLPIAGCVRAPCCGCDYLPAIADD